MKSVLGLLSLLIFSTNALAGSWHDVGKVTRVHSGHGSGVLYFSTEIQVSVESCINNSCGYTYSDNTINRNIKIAILK